MAIKAFSSVKNFYFFLIISGLFLASCSTYSKKEANTEPIKWEGNWISKDYLEAIEGNHSPYEIAINQSFYATELVFLHSKGDSVAVYNGQQEMAFLPYKKLGDTLRLKLNQDDFTDITYSREDKTLSFTDKQLNRVYKFVRADSTLIDRTFEMPIAFPCLVNKYTFEGFWELYEHNSTKKIVQFDKFGMLKGWDKYNTYLVCVNGDCAANEDGDVIYLGNQKTSDMYGFHSKGDTITIYGLKQTTLPNEKPSYKQSQPIGLLVRQKK